MTDPEPDPAYLGTEKWREHKAPSQETMDYLAIRIREAWRDYLWSGRVRGEKTITYGDARITVTVTRGNGDGLVPLGVLPGFWDPME